MWDELLGIIENTALSSERAIVVWMDGNKDFTVKSLYNSLQTRRPQKVYNVLWKI